MGGNFINSRNLARRWYDTKPYAGDVLDYLQDLPIRSHYDIAREVIKVIEIIKANNREREELPLSLGIDRVLGLYQEQNKRRWYDNSLPISRIFKTASCMSDEDFHNIMQGISMTLGAQNEQ